MRYNRREILFVYRLQRNTSSPGLVHQVSPSSLSWSSAGLAVIQKGSSHEYKQRKSRAIRVIWSEITQVSMHEEQSKYQVCGVKYWNYFDSPSKTYRQESKSSPRFQTFQQAQHKALWFLYTLGWQKKMQVKVFFWTTWPHSPWRGKTHSTCQVWFSWRTQVLHTKGSTPQAFVYCVQGKQGVKSAGWSNKHTHTLSNTRHTHTEKSRSEQYLNYFT